MSLFGVTRIEIALDGFVFGFLALVVGAPLVLLLRYYRLGTELRLLGRRTGVDRWTAVADYDWFRAVRGLPQRATGDRLDGPVQVTGEARPLEGTLAGPVSDEP